MDGEETGEAQARERAAVSNDGRGERKPRSFSLNATISCSLRSAKSSSRRQIRRMSFKLSIFKLLDSELPPDIWKDPKGYLYRTVVNACHDWRRSRKSRSRTSLNWNFVRFHNLEKYTVYLGQLFGDHLVQNALFGLTRSIFSRGALHAR